MSQTTAEHLVALVRQDRIQPGPDGSVLWRSRAFLPAEPGCYRDEQNATRLCLVEGPAGELFTVVGDLVLQKVGWYKRSALQFVLWIAFATFFLAAGWPRAALPRRQPSLRPQSAFVPQWPGSVARTAAALHFTFIALLAVTLATYSRVGATALLLYETPFMLEVALALPMIAAVLTIAAISGLGAVWRSSGSTSGIRLRFGILAAVLLAFLPFLHSWNLLGFRL